MAQTAKIWITADKRVPFDGTIARMGEDFTGAAALMEIRPEPGGEGAALVTLGGSTNGGEGIAITYDANYADPDGLMADGATLFQIFINETTLESLAYGVNKSDPVILHYDVHLDPVGEKKFVVFSGGFTVSPGVTR